MRILAFGRRNAREILRDPLSVAFLVGFPVALLLLLSAIEANLPLPLFALERLAPGIAVFALAFVTLFCATLLARDRHSALLRRLYATPMTPADFLLSYALPMIPIAVAQKHGFATSSPWGWDFLPTAKIAGAVALTVPVSLLYIALGLLFGSVLNVKQVGGICGAVLTNVAAWLSGIWFDLELVGGAFRRVAYFLPFVHAVEAERAAMSGDLARIPGHLLWVLGYAVATAALAIALFLRQMRRE